VRLEKLAAGHLDAVLAFETVNRDYFAASIPDRGDDFFANYPARHAALLALQEAGTDIFHVLVTDDGAVAGRVNLVYIAGGQAELGYRIGRDFAGRGLATGSVRRVCDLARSAYGLERLRAATTVDNYGSRTVLLRNGFTECGETTLSGRPATQFTLSLPAPA
jgi:ribosomal-protein-alanine N-acetyltransferase